MEQSRSGSEEKLIIVGNSSVGRLFFDIVMTLFFWIYTLVVIFYFASAIVDYNNPLSRLLSSSFKITNIEIRILILTAVNLFITFYVTLSINRIYNRRRFGSLARRIYPPEVTRNDLIALQLVDAETIEKLQTQSYLVFEENPVISLEEGKKR